MAAMKGDKQWMAFPWILSVFLFYHVTCAHYINAADGNIAAQGIDNDHDDDNMVPVVVGGGGGGGEMVDAAVDVGDGGAGGGDKNVVSDGATTETTVASDTSDKMQDTIGDDDDDDESYDDNDDDHHHDSNTVDNDDAVKNSTSTVPSPAMTADVTTENVTTDENKNIIFSDYDDSTQHLNGKEDENEKIDDVVDDKEDKKTVRNSRQYEDKMMKESFDDFEVEYYGAEDNEVSNKKENSEKKISRDEEYHRYTPSDYYFYYDYYGLSMEKEEEENKNKEHPFKPRPLDYRFYNEFFGLGEENEMSIDSSWREFVDEEVKKLSEFLESHNPCVLMNTTGSHMQMDGGEKEENKNDVDGVDDNKENDDGGGGEDESKAAMRHVERKVKGIVVALRPSCGEHQDKGDDHHKDNHNINNNHHHHHHHPGDSNHNNGDHNDGKHHSDEKYNKKNTTNNSQSRVKPNPNASHTVVEERVVYYHPYCWHNLRDPGDGKNNNNKNDNDNDMHSKRQSSHRNHEGCLSRNQNKHNLWEAGGAKASGNDGKDETHGCHGDKRSQRPCIDVFSQESMMSQLCSRMASLENGSECITSRLATNEMDAEHAVTKLSQQIKDLAKAIDLLQRSSVFYAEAPFSSSQVRGYRVKVRQGQGFDPATGYFTAPYDGVYQITVGYYKRVTSNRDERINVIMENTAIFKLRVEGTNHQHVFMTTLQSGQSLSLKTNVKMGNNVDDLDIDFIFFGVVLVK